MFAASKTAGAAAATAANYIEDVFSTYLYTGNGSTQTITNGIDLSTKGGLVWMKCRSTGTTDNTVYDTARGVNYPLFTNTTAASSSDPGTFAAFNTTGFRLNNAYTALNETGQTYASWTFRKQPKFFDVVTYTGNGTAGRSVSHNLGAVPGCIIIKSTTRTGSEWVVYHRSVGSSATLTLNSTAASADYGNNISSVTSTSFNVTGGSDSNANGSGYVAYLFAHDAGGFGLTGTDNVISCGSYTGTGGPVAVTLGYEPQWIMFKSATSADNWRINDVMRGMPTGGTTVNLAADLSNAEYGSDNRADVTSTGFIANGANSQSGVTHIYIAIRRGPMKVPTDATKVFAPVAYTGNSNLSTTTTNTLTNGFAADAGFYKARNDSGPNWGLVDKLRGKSVYLETNVTTAESTQTSSQNILFNNTQAILTGYASTDFNFNYSVNTFIEYAFQRAPNFFDEVCYTGNGSQFQGVPHNLGVKPEWVIFKSRNTGGSAQDDAWQVIRNDPSTDLYYLYRLNTTNGQINVTDTSGYGYFNATTIYGQRGDLGSGLSNARTNVSGTTYVAYLFASCAGVSKVGSYTGTGTTQQINCGFTGGARFVLIKRTDSTGDWYVWDSARGIVAGNDPYLLLNSTAAEVTSTDYVDTYSAGFEISSTAPAAINASGGTFIFLAIA